MITKADAVAAIEAEKYADSHVTAFNHDGDDRPETYNRALDDAIAAINALPDSGWRDIDIAPRDGSILLLYCPNGIDRLYVSPDAASKFCLGFHGDNGGMLGMADNWQSVESREEIWGYGSEYTGAMTETATVPCQPTHWQPLPTPPLEASLLGKE